MSLHSWGNYPKTKNRVLNFGHDTSLLRKIILEYNELIPRGNGRSYGDSALSKNIIQAKPHNFFLNFYKSKGILDVQSGVLLSEILETFVPMGWFLKISPGTKLITVGGAIASDVHGKNHHLEGCFSECVEFVRLMLPNGKVVKCSKQKNKELFRATCGGMGLTGVILDARISLKKIESKYIDQKTIKTENLKETFCAFERYKNEPYSVAWVDCLAKGRKIGRSLLFLGDFSHDGDLDYKTDKKLNIPFYFPSFVLTKLSAKAFNSIYYRKVRDKISHQRMDIDTFFYPLDWINNWNRIYGKSGFTQYQFILPKETSFEGLEKILKEISKSGRGSFLGVIKLYGAANKNYLSFPMEGYSLALDFKIENGLFELLDRLDRIVLESGGRIYLAKDARVTKDTFEQGYPKINKFRNLREKYEMTEKFNSLQSLRIGI